MGHLAKTGPPSLLRELATYFYAPDELRVLTLENIRSMGMMR